MDCSPIRLLCPFYFCSRSEYWSGLPLPPPGELPNPGIKPISSISCTAGRFFTNESLGKPQLMKACVYLSTMCLFLHCKEYNQSDFGVDHLVMSMCTVFSCVIGRGCLLWPLHYLGKTLLVFALLHSVLQGQISLLLQVFPDFLLLLSSSV